ncbi:MAG: PD40 domain-containing protein [Phycisphaerae bacterium]|nr:PD40 domain-containing protein [Phycisphaerae bacterium]
MKSSNTRRYLRLAAQICCAAIVASCSKPDSGRTSVESAQPMPQARDAGYAIGSDADAGLHLFGRNPGLSDVAFEGKAATGLLQHTSQSEGADFDPDVDRTGRLLVFASTRNSHNSHLYIKSVDGATITQITDGSANDAQPTFDPSGQRIAFASDRAGQWDIWVIDASGRNPIQITNSPAPEMHPSWSPDGKRLVFCRIDPKENRNLLWVVELDNPGVKRLIGEGLFPAWSPDGSKIAYQRARARSSRYFSIWTLDIHGDEVLYPTEVAANASGAMIAPAWSPDGRQLTFAMIDPNGDSGGAGMSPMRGMPGRCDIAIVDVDGRGLQKLTDGPGQFFAPVWATDGRIYFSSREGGTESIWSTKPFRPMTYSEDTPSAVKTSDRQAAYANETAEGE